MVWPTLGSRTAKEQEHEQVVTSRNQSEGQTVVTRRPRHINNSTVLLIVNRLQKLAYHQRKSGAAKTAARRSPIGSLHYELRTHYATDPLVNN